MQPTRRRFLGTAAAAGALLVAPRLVFANVASERRFVFVIQRGAADGLNIVVPYAEPAYASLRGDLAIDAAQATRLDGTFALHPSLAQTAAMYAGGQALFVHAIASPYRDRSHFDGQNVLETGGRAPYQLKDGWLNRLAAMLPATRENAIALAPTVLAALYERDAQLGPLWASAMVARGLAGDAHARQDPAGVGKLAAGFLARDDGPRIAMIETGGWDTHSAQNPRLANVLKGLDAMLAALRDGLGPVWRDTTVLVATEFGRTAAANGTGGTDHGQASVAMLLGGAVAGGRVIADWPGLRGADLYEGRDLKPTASLDALIAGAAAETLRLEPQRTAATLFGQAGARHATSGLVRA